MNVQYCVLPNSPLFGRLDTLPSSRGDDNDDEDSESDSGLDGNSDGSFNGNSNSNSDAEDTLTAETASATTTATSVALADDDEEHHTAAAAGATADLEGYGPDGLAPGMGDHGGTGAGEDAAEIYEELEKQSILAGAYEINPDRVSSEAADFIADVSFWKSDSLFSFRFRFFFAIPFRPPTCNVIRPFLFGVNADELIR